MGFSWAAASESLSENLERIREKEIREEEIALQRENALFELGLTKEKDRAKYLNSDKYVSSANAVKRLKNRLKDLDLTPDQEKYFNSLSQDPQAVKEVFDFIDQQEKDYNTVIPIQDLEDYIAITTSDISEEEQIDLLELITGQDFSGDKGKQRFYDLSTQINEMVTTPGRTVFTDIKPGSRVSPEASLKKQDAQVQLVLNSIVGDAYAYQIQNPGDNTLNGILESVTNDNPAIKRSGIIQLFNYKPENRNVSFGSPFALDALIKSDPAMKGFEKTSLGKQLRNSYLYPPPDPNMSEALRADPSPENIRVFDLLFGEEARKEVLSQQ